MSKATSADEGVDDRPVEALRSGRWPSEDDTRRDETRRAVASPRRAPARPAPGRGGTTTRDPFGPPGPPGRGEPDLADDIRDALRSGEPVALLSLASTLVAVADPRERNPFEPDRRPELPPLSDLVRIDWLALSSALRPLEPDLRLDVNPVVISSAGWDGRRTDPFLSTVTERPLVKLDLDGTRRRRTACRG